MPPLTIVVPSWLVARLKISCLWPFTLCIRVYVLPSHMRSSPVESPETIFPLCRTLTDQTIISFGPPFGPAPNDMVLKLEPLRMSYTRIALSVQPATTIFRSLNVTLMILAFLADGLTSTLCSWRSSSLVEYSTSAPSVQPVIRLCPSHWAEPRPLASFCARVSAGCAARHQISPWFPLAWRRGRALSRSHSVTVVVYPMLKCLDFPMIVLPFASCSFGSWIQTSPSTLRSTPPRMIVS